MAEVCLAPDGDCRCAKVAAGSIADPDAAPCWRVRVPWWSQSSTLLPFNVHTQLVTSGSKQESSEEQAPLQEPTRKKQGRPSEASRTPSPDYGYRRSSKEHMLPPKLRLAPSSYNKITKNPLDSRITSGATLDSGTNNFLDTATADVCLAPGGCACAKSGKPVEARSCGRVTVSIPGPSTEASPAPSVLPAPRAPRSKWLLAKLEKQTRGLSASGDASQDLIDGPAVVPEPAVKLEQATQDVCLAPNGDCACARSGQVIGDCGSRVKVPASALWSGTVSQKQAEAESVTMPEATATDECLATNGETVGVGAELNVSASGLAARSFSAQPPIATQDVCLAPGGCACAETGKPVEARSCGRVTVSIPGPSTEACARNGEEISKFGARVKVSASALSSQLASEALDVTFGGRYGSRTPSPDLSREVFPGGRSLPLPRLLLAPVAPQVHRPTSLACETDVIMPTLAEKHYEEVRPTSLARGADAMPTLAENHNEEDDVDVGSTRSRRRPRRGRHSALRVATQLKKLDDVEPDRVVAVRKIACLGLQAYGSLKTYFQTFGDVEEVLLSGAHEREDVEKSERLRPSGFGFVVMTDAAGARAAFREGDSHRIGEHEFQVQPFLRKSELAVDPHEDV